jgi:protein involved in polysaccharide export with SLBB domain
VTVGGEVNKPGRYFVKPGTTLDEVVAMAGGLTHDAYAYGSVFIRDSLRRQQQINFDKAVGELKETLTADPLVSTYARQGDMNARLAAVNSLVDQLRSRRIDGRLVLNIGPDSTNVPGDFVVENNDAIYIPPHPLMVGVYGLVNSTADYRYMPGEKIDEYITKAGGYNRLADKGHVFVVRANGTVIGGKQARGIVALPGDLVFVPVDSNRGATWERIKDIAGLLFSGAATVAVVNSL